MAPQGPGREGRRAGTEHQSHKQQSFTEETRLPARRVISRLILSLWPSPPQLHQDPNRGPDSVLPLPSGESDIHVPTRASSAGFGAPDRTQRTADGGRGGHVSGAPLGAAPVAPRPQAPHVQHGSELADHQACSAGAEAGREGPGAGPVPSGLGGQPVSEIPVVHRQRGGGEDGGLAVATPPRGLTFGGPIQNY